jgi:SAM-dependent methyltransferase
MLRAAMTQAAEMWGSADYERIARRFADVHDELVGRLRPGPGVRWLDVATGTGGVAIRAARAGADVTGVDIAPRLLEQARVKADGLPIRFDEGNAQRLPYADASFDVVSSVFGAIFAPDHEAVAREFARVCAAGGRLGLTAWVPNAELTELFQRFGLVQPEGAQPFDWGREGYADRLLGRDFELEIEQRTWFLTVPDGEAAWELWSNAAPPFRTMIGELDRDVRERFHAAYVEYADRFRRPDGDVAVPREYLLVLGRRRGR